MIEFDQNKLRDRIIKDSDANDLKRLETLAQEAQSQHQSDLALYLLGRKAFLEKNYPEALKKIEDSLTIEPTLYQAHNLRVTTLIESGDLQGAIHAANSAMQAMPLLNHAQLYLNKGVAYNRMNRLEEAKFCYLKSITLMETYVYPYRNLLSILVHKEEWNDVIVLTQRIAEKLSNNVEFLAEIAAVLLTQAQISLVSSKQDLDSMLTKEARNILEAAFRADPNNVDVLYNLACSYAREGNRDQAIKYLHGTFEKAASPVLPTYKQIASKDQDFAKIKQDPEFINLVH